MTDTAQIAKYILTRNNSPMTLKKLQKLVYYCDAWHTTALDRPLTPEVPEAWDKGPVFRSLWSRLSYSYTLGSASLPDVEPAELSDESRQIVDSVLDFYCPWSDSQLIEQSHDERPWKKAREEAGQNAPISPESMREYYSGVIARNEARPHLPFAVYNYVLAEDLDKFEASKDDETPAPGLVSMLLKAKTG